MNQPCEWCVSTSNQIDSIEYQNEQLIIALEAIKLDREHYMPYSHKDNDAWKIANNAIKANKGK